LNTVHNQQESKFVGQIKKDFVKAAPRCSHGNKNFLPARDFEFHAGIDGISAHYVFPRGISATWYDKYLEKADYASRTRKCYSFNKDHAPSLKSPDPALMADMLKDWDELAALNPGLKKVRLDRGSPMNLLNALYGVVSQFNVDDINNFLEVPRITGRRAVAVDNLKIHDMSQTQVKIEIAAGTQVEWVLSPATLKKIEQALEKKTGNPLDWVLSPENEKKIRQFMAKKWTKPTDTPEETAQIKALTEGRFGDALDRFGRADSLVRHFNDKDLRDIRRMLFGIKTPPHRNAPRRDAPKA
jgi:hypothetical protein